MYSVDLTELQNVVGKYVDQYHLLTAGGPLVVATATKAFVTENTAVNMAVTASGAWFAVQELSGPMLKLMESQFGYLHSILDMFKG